MTSSIARRYDRSAEDYLRYWAPVLDAAALGLLERCTGLLGAVEPGRRPRVVDVGTGTGVLALGALGQWPEAEVVAVDASRGMLRIAERLARKRAAPEAIARLEFRVAEADRLRLPERSADLVVSSFVYQLVSDRPAALAEACRVLRPGGWLAFVTWLDESEPFAPADEFDEAVLDLGVEEPEDEPEDRAGDYASPDDAALELRRAGFEAVTAHRGRLEYRWDLDSFLAYKEHYDERGLFGDLRPNDRARLRVLARDRLARLHPEAFVWHAPVVYATARRPGGR